MDPKAISAPRHTPDTRRRLINPRDFRPDTNFQPLWQMSHGASVGHRQPSYVVSKLRSTDVGFWGQIRAFTFHHFQATSWEVFSVSVFFFLSGLKIASQSRWISEVNTPYKTFHSVLSNAQADHNNLLLHWLLKTLEEINSTLKSVL